MVIGVAHSATAFVAGLNRTISKAATSQRTVLVFRLRGIAKGLLTWNDNPPIDAELARVSVEQHLLATEPHLALLALPDGELLGFDTEPKQDRREADQLGGRLLGALAKPMGEPGREFVVSVRLGAAIFDPGDSSADQVTQADPVTQANQVTQADQAIQAAGRALQQTSFATPFLVHNSYIADRSTRLEETGNLLPNAMAGNQITVEYQPRVGAQDRLITEIEVLPRWYHRERGTIPPREFLRAAESTGRLIELGQSTRREAVTAAHKWQLAGRLQNCRMWMNIAPVELCHPGLVEEVAGLVTGRPSLLLGFEVSDSGLLEDLAFLRLFDRLQEFGVQLAVDNVNHSRLSFGRLRRLPVSSINLDGELVRSLPSSAANRDLVRLICAMAAEQDQTVTACGIETSEQLEVAAVLGVDRLQGFGISKVLSHASMEEYLDSEVPRQ
ncbi:MAG: EAL domain-containing protein [Acidimicrobiales bacterium]